MSESTSPSPGARRNLARMFARALLGILTASVLLLVVILLGELTREELKDHPHYRSAFSSIEVDPPHGISREQFLAEVQYLGMFSDHLERLGSRLPGELRKAFEAHPEVGRVERISLSSRCIAVGLSYHRR